MGFGPPHSHKVTLFLTHFAVNSQATQRWILQSQHAPCFVNWHPECWACSCQPHQILIQCGCTHFWFSFSQPMIKDQSWVALKTPYQVQHLPVKPNLILTPAITDREDIPKGTYFLSLLSNNFMKKTHIIAHPVSCLLLGQTELCIHSHRKTLNSWFQILNNVL